MRFIRRFSLALNRVSATCRSSPPIKRSWRAANRAARKKISQSIFAYAYMRTTCPAICHHLPRSHPMSIEQIVQERYGSVATRGLSSDHKGVKAIAEAFGYSQDQLASIPAE